MKMTNWYLTFLLVFSAFSCTTVYFDRPQPVDSENLRIIPREFRGVWVQGQDTTVITGTSFCSVKWYNETLSKLEIDTSKTIKIIGDSIYDLSDESEAGYAFTMQNDSITVHIPELQEYTLSNSVLLRSVSKKYLMVNLKKSEICWEVYLVELMEKGSIAVRSVKVSGLEKLAVLKPNDFLQLKVSQDLILGDNEEYWKAAFTKSNLVDFIDIGGFSDTTLVMDSKYKVDYKRK